MNALRFITAGSVDDGKSTMIGRLLFDSRNIFVDQLEALERHSRADNRGRIDLSLVTDGLRAEREQGITIDLAYRYFHSSRRKFVVIDAPGHIQYTRNMVTGASNAHLMIILVDARHGPVEQTRRHAAVASLLNIPQVVVAINKMDLVGYSEGCFNAIVGDFEMLASALKLRNVVYLPVSALLGDNIVERSANMDWYQGRPLLSLLEETDVAAHEDQGAGRLSVQYVICQRSTFGKGRHYAGRIGSGSFHKDGLVTIFPSGSISHILAIEEGGREVMEAHVQRSVAIRLEDHLDISRGDLLVTGRPPHIGQDLEMLVFWMDENVLQSGSRYLLQVATRRVRCVVRSIDYLLDIKTMDKHFGSSRATLNDIVRVRIRTATPVAYDPYTEIRANGCGILIDETSGATSGACILM